jgi:hypothetical protein
MVPIDPKEDLLLHMQEVLNNLLAVETIDWEQVSKKLPDLVYSTTVLTRLIEQSYLEGDERA